MRTKTILPPCALPPTCSTREAAQLLGISVRTAQLWVEDGRLLAWKTPGGHRRILRSSIDQLISEQQVSTQHERPGRNLMILDADNERGSLLCREILDAFPDCTIRLLANPFECVLKIGEQAPDILVAPLSAVRTNDFGLLRTVAGNPMLASMLVVVLHPPTQITDLLPPALANEVTLIAKRSPNEELIRLIHAYLQGCRNTGRAA